MRRTWYTDCSRATHQYKTVHGMLWHIGMVSALATVVLGLVLLAAIVHAFTPRHRFKTPPPPPPWPGKAADSLAAHSLESV